MAEKKKRKSISLLPILLGMGLVGLLILVALGAQFVGLERQLEGKLFMSASLPVDGVECSVELVATNASQCGSNVKPIEFYEVGRVVDGGWVTSEGELQEVVSRAEGEARVRALENVSNHCVTSKAIEDARSSLSCGVGCIKKGAPACDVVACGKRGCSEVSNMKPLNVPFPYNVEVTSFSMCNGSCDCAQECGLRM